MKNTLETRLGIFVVLAVIAAVLILEVIGGVDRFQPGYRLIALFSSVSDLKEGDRVKMGGFEVGHVDSIHLDETNNKVRVTLKVKKNVVVRNDSEATIKFTGLMGENFVALTFGSPGKSALGEGDYVQTKDPRDLSETMEKLDKVAGNVENFTRSFTGIKIDQLLGPLMSFVQDNKAPLTATISNLQTVSSQIAQGKGTVGRLLNEDTLYTSALTSVSNLQDAATEIKLTVADARKVVDQVNSGHGTVGRLLHDEGLYRETMDSMTSLKEILQKINQGQGTVGKIINDQDLYKNAKLTLQKLDKATEGLEDQGPISVIGILVNNLF
jgi:phospholipid/cholesterol/gamma-HCH transport system substrate-binding protein